MNSENYTNVSLDDVDCIVFDCDGVLVDVRESYDMTIKKTVQHILYNVAKVEPLQVTSEMIDGFKATGGFNDEVDLAYSCILSAIAAKSWGKSPADVVFCVIEHANSTGVESVEEYLGNVPEVLEMKKKLAYPGRHNQSLLYETFDQLFYGPELFFKMFKKESSFSDPGLIENDRLLLTQELLQDLAKNDRKIAMVTGRGYESVQYTLGSLLDGFDVKNSFFLEDEPRSLAKPNPESLIRTITSLNCTHCLYVGDSVEDMLMAQGAAEAGKNVTFCGIFGTSNDPQAKQNLFNNRGADVVLDSIEHLSALLH